MNGSLNNLNNITKIEISLFSITELFTRITNVI